MGEGDEGGKGEEKVEERNRNRYKYTNTSYIINYITTIINVIYFDI